jgi:Flp pilus assembly protein TadG
MRKTRKASFGSANEGGVAITFGLMLPILMLFLALGIDISRLYYVQTRVQFALDAASLAGAKLLDEAGMTDADIQLRAQAYFNQNMPASSYSGATLINFKATPDYVARSVRTTVDVNMPMLFAKAGNSISSIHIPNPNANSVYKTLHLEVALVLDNTGSMLETAADGTQKIVALRATAKAFIDALYANNPQPGYVKVALAPYGASLNAGPLSFFLAGMGSDTCVVDRDGAKAYTDDVPTGTSLLGRSNTGLSPYYSCPAATFRPLTDLSNPSTRASFKTAIDNMDATGATAGQIGAAWGWYLLSPKWSSIFGSSAGAANSNQVRKIVILLTDGIFNTAYNNGGNALSGTPSGMDPLVTGSSPYQALRLCENMRAPGSDITIFTVGFTTPTAAEDILKTCSGAANFYPADSAGDLTKTFAKIAAELVNLRVSS